MKIACIIDFFVLAGFLALCVWEWRRDVNAKARNEAAAFVERLVGPSVAYSNFIAAARLDILAAGFVQIESGVYVHPDGRVWEVEG